MLFQVFFLALLLEERGAGGLDDVAEAMTAKLIRRHPHVFGDVEAESAGEVLSQLERDQARRARGRALRRATRDPARRRCTPRSCRRAPHAPESGSPRSSDRSTRSSARRRAWPTPPASASASSAWASCCWPRSTPRGTSASTPSWRCARRRRATGTTSSRLRAESGHDRDDPRASDPRLARQPDGRGRGRARFRRARARRRALGRLDGRVRGHRAARRRPGVGRQGRVARGAQRQRDDRRGARGRERRRPVGDRPHADRARRDAEQVAARAPTRSSACRSPSPAPRRRMPASRSTAISGARTRTCCRCR